MCALNRAWRENHHGRRAGGTAESSKGFEIYLTRVGEHCDKREIYGKKGPVYAFDISTNAMTKILYVEPVGAEPVVFVSGSKADPKLIREVLSTLKVFQVEGPG